MPSGSQTFSLTRAARLVLAASSGALLLAASPDQSTYNRKLSGPFQLPPTVHGSIDQFALTPDGAQALYRADQEAAFDFGLYRVASDGSTAPTWLAEHAFSGPFRISPDGEFAVMQGAGLSSVRVDGSAPAAWIQAPVYSLVEFAISPDSSRVVFIGQDGGLQVPALYSAPIAGGPGVRLAFPAHEFLVAPGAMDVVFVGGPHGDFRLLRVPIDGSSAAVEIAPGSLPMGAGTAFLGITTAGRVLAAAGGDLYSVLLDGSSPAVQVNSSAIAYAPAVSPDETCVLFLGDDALYSAPVDGSAPALQLSPTLPPGASVESFAIAPAGAFAVYRADPLTPGQLELFRVPIDGSAPAIRLNAALVPGGDVADYAISPDGLRVAYRADQDALSVLELYSVASSGGPAVRLNAPLVAGGDVQLVRIAADSTQVYYWADQDADERVELFHAPIDGSSGPTKLSGATGLPSQVAQGAGRIVYTLGDAFMDGALGNALVSTPADGSSSTVTLNAPLPLGPHAGDVVATPAQPSGFSLAPDGARAVYLADQDVDEELELYGVPTNGGAASAQLSAPLIPGGDVQRWWVAPDSRGVAYLADGDTDGVVELYGSSLDGSWPATKLNPPLVAGGHVIGSLLSQSGAPVIAPDGARVAYRADGSADEVFELFCAPLDGSATALKLNGPLAAGGDVLSLAITTTRVVYRADQTTNDRFELFSAPSAGGGAAVRISATLAAGGDVTDFALTTDGVHAVYRADQVNNVFELFRVPVDASAAPVKLSGTLALNSDVEADFALAATGERVVYRLLNSLGTAELHSAPRDGSSAPVELSGVLVAGGSVVDFEISPDGAWVVYSADQDVDERFEIYGSPSDGSAPPVRLNGSLAFGDVSEYSISPDSSRVAYLASQESVIRELFCAPIGGGVPVKLSGGGQPSSFAFAPDGRHVLYLANDEIPAVHELYRVSVTGSTRSRVHPPSSTFATIYSFALTSDSRRVLYRADQDQSDVYELYGSQIARGAQRAEPP